VLLCAAVLGAAVLDTPVLDTPEPVLVLELSGFDVVPVVLVVPVTLVVSGVEGTTYVVAMLAGFPPTTVCVVGSLQVTFPVASVPQHSHSFVFALNVTSSEARLPQPRLQWESVSVESVQPPT
jgi:hypothetical protein